MVGIGTMGFFNIYLPMIICLHQSESALFGRAIYGNEFNTLSTWSFLDSESAIIYILYEKIDR